MERESGKEEEMEKNEMTKKEMHMVSWLDDVSQVVNKDD